MKTSANIKQIGRSVSLGNFTTSGSIGTATNTVDNTNVLIIRQTSLLVSLILPNPTDISVFYALAIINEGSVSVNINTISLNPGFGLLFVWTGVAWRYTV